VRELIRFESLVDSVMRKLARELIRFESLVDSVMRKLARELIRVTIFIR
jgi:uncharacterized protein Yka (UPF0111/DUF47 family)